MWSALPLFNASPHTKIKRTFRHGYMTDDLITLTLQKIYISWQELFSYNVVTSQTWNWESYVTCIFFSCKGYCKVSSYNYNIVLNIIIIGVIIFISVNIVIKKWNNGLVRRIVMQQNKTKTLKLYYPEKCSSSSMYLLNFCFHWKPICMLAILMLSYSFYLAT